MLLVDRPKAWRRVWSHFKSFSNWAPAFTFPLTQTNFDVNDVWCAYIHIPKFQCFLSNGLRDIAVYKCRLVTRNLALFRCAEILPLEDALARAGAFWVPSLNDWPIETTDCFCMKLHRTKVKRFICNPWTERPVKMSGSVSRPPSLAIFNFPYSSNVLKSARFCVASEVFILYLCEVSSI